MYNTEYIYSSFVRRLLSHMNHYFFLNVILSDYSKGFGGKFGVQEDRKDKSALGWDHHEAPQKHESQLDHKVVSENGKQNFKWSSNLCYVIILGFWWKIRCSKRSNG